MSADRLFIKFARPAIAIIHGVFERVSQAISVRRINSIALVMEIAFLTIPDESTHFYTLASTRGGTLLD